MNYRRIKNLIKYFIKHISQQKNFVEWNTGCIEPKRLERLIQAFVQEVTPKSIFVSIFGLNLKP